MSTTPRDYYEVLEVSKNASPDEIKRAFRKKAKACHPDTNKSETAEAEFKELGEAYEVLSDASKKQVYDTYGHDGLRGRGYQPQYDFAEGFPDLGDLFSSFFGGQPGSSRNNPNAPQAGNDLKMGVELAFEEAVFGAQKEILFTHLTCCESCDATGASPGSGPTDCSTCGGQGQVRQTTQTIIGHFTQITTCPNCKGKGSIIVNPCTDCHGQGRKATESKCTISIPPGVDQGNRLRVSGEGDVGIRKGPPGDLYVVLQIKPHDRFVREGYHLKAEQEIPYTTMVLGGEFVFETLEGTHKIKVPAGTQNGHVFKLKGEGVPHLNNSKRRGDCFIQVQVHIPQHVNHETRKLLEKLAPLEEPHKQKSPAGANASSSFIGRFKEAFTG